MITTFVAATSNQHFKLRLWGYGNLCRFLTADLEKNENGKKDKKTIFFKF